MHRMSRTFVVISILAGVFLSCSKESRLYRKYTLKGTVSQRDSAAFYYYENEDYSKAAFLLEDLLGYYRASKRYTDILYHLAWAKYKQRAFIEAANHFEQFTKQYPNDERSEECGFQLAMCYYQESLPYYLDQGPTLIALNQFEYFNAANPLSSRREECERYINLLRERLARKAFEQAKLYYRIEDFVAAVRAFEVMIRKHPDTRYREEAEFLWFMSTADYADKSTVRRKKNRYLDAIERYNRFIDRYPNSVFLKEAEDKFVKVKRALGEILAEEEAADASR